MRIIHVEDYFDPTAGYQINELLMASNPLKDETIIISSFDLSPFHKQYNEVDDLTFENKYHVKIIRLKSMLKLSSRIILKGMWKEIDSLNPDLVFLHGIGDFKDLLLYKKKKNYIIIRDCHMSWVASKNPLRHIYYLAYKVLFSRRINSSEKIKLVYALGEEEKEYLNKLGIKNNKIGDLKHGYNEENMFYDSVERESLRKIIKVNHNEVLISYIGKFDFQKRPDFIFDIVEEMMLKNEKNNENEKIKLKFLFVGPKEIQYFTLFKDKLDKFIFKDDVQILDAVPFKDLYKFYSASDICIFPKQASLSSIHAQICYTPVIMERMTSNKERVLLGKNLYLENNFEEAADILIRIVNNLSTEISELKNNLYKFEEREYSNQVKKLNSILNYKM